MEDKILENEKVLNENIEAETVEAPVEDVVEEPVEEIKEKSQEDVAEEKADDKEEQPAEESAPVEKIQVAPVDKAEFVPETTTENNEVVTEEAPEAKENFFKSIKWQRTWDKITLALLLLAIAIPLGLLAYVVITFFL